MYKGVRSTCCLLWLVAAHARASEVPLDFGELRFAAAMPINDGEVHSFDLFCNKGACRLDFARLTKRACDASPKEAVWLEASEYESNGTQAAPMHVNSVGSDAVEVKFQTYLGTWTANADLLIRYGVHNPKSDSAISRRIVSVTGSLSGIDFYTKTIRTERYTLLDGPVVCQLKVSE